MEKITIDAEVFGQTTQALMSKKNVMYVKCTLCTKGDDGRINKFYNACFFPDPESLVKVKEALCQGRMVTVTGNYSEREYEGKDGNMKTSHDLLVHNVDFGGIAQYDGEAKSTTYSFIKKEDEQAVEKGMSKAAAKPAKPQPRTKVNLPDNVPTKPKAGAKTASEAVFSEEGEEDFNIDDLDL